ncbi:unnamed protein product [Closterium sp. NIES-54]
MFDKIYAGAMAAQELRWLTYLLTDLGEPPRSPPVLYVDNKAMLALCREHRLEHRTKHIALRYFLARELQQRGQLRLAYVASQANTADIFTKALQPCDHQRFCTMLAYANNGRSFASPEDEAAAAVLDPADDHPGISPRPRGDDDDDDDSDDAPTPRPSCHHAPPSDTSPTHESDDDDMVEVTTEEAEGASNLTRLQLLGLHTSVTTLTCGVEPKNPRQALTGPHAKEWRAAMDAELKALESPSKYAEQLGKCFNILPAPLSTPYRNPSVNYKPDNKPLSPAGLQLYQQKLGCLLFASVTCRPDLSYIASQLAQYSRKPVVENQLDLECTLQYFISTPDIGLSYSMLTTTSFNLNGYVDADHAADPANRRPVVLAVPSRCPCRRVAPADPSHLLSRPVALAVASPLLSRPVPSPLLSRHPCCPVPSPLLSRRLCCPVPSPLPSHRPCCPVPCCRPCCPVTSPPAVPSHPDVPLVPSRCPPSVLLRRAVRLVPSRPPSPSAASSLTAIKARYATPTTVSLGRLFLPFLFPDLASLERTADLITHLHSLDSSYRAACTDAQLALLPPPMAITIYFITTSLPGRLASVCDALLLKHPSELTIEVLESALKDVERNLHSVAFAFGVVPPPLFHGCTVPHLPTFTASLATTATDVTVAAVTNSSRSRGGSGKRGGRGVGSGGESAGTGGAPRVTAGDSPAAAGGGDAQVRQPPTGLPAAGGGASAWSLLCSAIDTVRLAYGVDGPAPDWLPLVQTYGPALWGMSASQLVDLFGTPHAMYAVVDSSDSDSVYSSVVSLGASLAEVPVASVGTCVDTSSGAALEDALLSFTLYSGASHCVFHDRTSLTSLPTPVSIALADHTLGPVTARYTTTLPCPGDPSGSLTGFHVPSFSRNLVGVWPLVSQHVGVWIEPSGETAQQQLLPPTPVTVPRQVPASHQFAVSPQVAMSCQHSTVQRTPLAVDHRLTGPFPDEPFEPSGPYAKLVGCLMTSCLLVTVTLSYADDAETQRSTQGYCFNLGSGAVLWRSTRSSSVSTSTAEAEIYAGAMAAQELRWLTFLLTDLSERPSSAPTLFTDNKATILLCREPRLASRVKDINVVYFLL